MMRRGREENIDIWPAFTDFLTGLSFVLLFVLAGLVAVNQSVIQERQRLENEKSQLKAEQTKLESKRAELEKQLLGVRLESDCLADRRKKFKEHFDANNKVSSAQLFQYRSQYTDRLVVHVTFATGAADLTNQGIQDLRGVASLIITRIDLFQSLEVEGHSDDQPLLGGGMFASNWELSAARAGTVVRFLRDTYPTRIPPWKIKASGRAMYRPAKWDEDRFRNLDRAQIVAEPSYVKKANADESLRATNRRIEILLNYRTPTEAEIATYQAANR